MLKNTSKELIKNLLAQAHIEINGKNPWDIQIDDDRFYQRIIKSPSIAAGESYMDGWWSCKKLDEFFYRILCAQLYKDLKDWRIIVEYFKNYLLNLQTQNQSKKVAEVHYNLDNQLYSFMLGPSMAYTCAYWKDTDNLDDAQNNKYDLICRKLNLQTHDHVLDLGCGFGGFARYAAIHYGCQLTCVNISEAQIHYARKHQADLPITYVQTDYRNQTIYNPKQIEFDKVVSIGMCEHVGSKNYHEFMRIVYSQLKNHGLFLLHTIGSNTTVNSLDPWFDKYIFPHGHLPSIQELGLSMEDFFIMEDWHNFGTDYDKTLMAWYNNFQDHWPELSGHYDQRFYRMWVYYLLSCAGMFRAREAELWQVVLSKGRGQKGYHRVT